MSRPPRAAPKVQEAPPVPEAPPAREAPAPAGRAGGEPAGAGTALPARPIDTAPTLPPAPVDEPALLAWLAQAGIVWTLHRHPPVFTVEEAERHTGHLPGTHTKNLLLEDKAGGLWLVTCADRQVVKVNGLARLLGCPRLSFASAARLRSALGVEPGSVTPLALVNDRSRQVTPVWDARLLAGGVVNVHPLVNTATCALAPADLVRFATLTGHVPLVLDLDATTTA